MYSEAIQHPRCQHLLITQLENHPLFPLDAWFPVDRMKNEYTLVKNITKKVLAALVVWEGTGKLTRQTVQENIDRLNDADISEEDAFATENGLCFRFLMYQRK